MENITICEALSQFIQKYCKNCQDAHCFGPACADGTGKCVAMTADNKPADFGTSKVVSQA